MRKFFNKTALAFFGIAMLISGFVLTRNFYIEHTISESEVLGTSINFTDDGNYTINILEAYPEALADTLSILSNPEHGDVSINNEVLTYSPNDNYSGLDNFVFEICEATTETGTELAQTCFSESVEINVLSTTNSGPGSIEVCLAIIDQNDNPLNFSELGNFSVSLPAYAPENSSEGPSVGQIPSTSFNNNSSQNKNLFGITTENDSSCVKYSNLPYGNYYYPRANVSVENLSNFGYNDFFSDQLTGFDVFRGYDQNLFDGNGSNDNARNRNSDGHINLLSGNKNRQLVLLMQIDINESVEEGEIIPILNCVERNDNFDIARLGYTSTFENLVNYEIGDENRFTPGIENKGQPTEFYPGENLNVFNVEFTGSISWELDGNELTIDDNSTSCNRPPEANNDSYTTKKNTKLTVNISDGVLSNDSDPDGEEIRVVGIDNIRSEYSGIEINSNGSFSYTPVDDFIGNYTFIYEICDESDLCDEAVVEILVTDITVQSSPTPTPTSNSRLYPPTAVDDYAQVTRNESVNIGILDNDYDEDGTLDRSSLEVVDLPENGKVEKSGIDFIYTPNKNYYGSDVFRYEICDNDNLCDEANVYIVVNNNTIPPVAVDDNAITKKNQSVEIDILNNDYDEDGNLDYDTLEILGLPTNGIAEIINNKVVYSPYNNYTGTDSFTYRICDSDEQCDDALVSITITPDNSPPVAIENIIEVYRNEPKCVDVLANDYDTDGELNESTLIIITDPEFGAAVVDGKAICYTPTNLINEDEIEYKICDYDGACDSTTVKVVKKDKVEELNLPPIAVDDEKTIKKNTLTEIDILINDSDPDSEVRFDSVEILTDPENGTIELDYTNNQVIYTPTPGYVGKDEFIYQISDETGNSAQATVRILVVDDVNQVIFTSDFIEPLEQLPSTNEEDNGFYIVSASALGLGLISGLLGILGFIGTPNPMGISLNKKNNLQTQLKLARRLGAGYFKPDSVFINKIENNHE